MFNLQGSEIIFILLIALVVLGPEKLPGAVRRVTSLYSELRKMSTGFQDEFKSALDEPLREMRETADLVKGAADPKRIAEEAEREAELEAAAAKKAKQARETTAAMEVAGAQHLAEASELPPPPVNAEPVGAFAEPVDAFADPVDENDAADTVAEDAVVVGENVIEPRVETAQGGPAGETTVANVLPPPAVGLSSADVDFVPGETSS